MKIQLHKLNYLLPLLLLILHSGCQTQHPAPASIPINPQSPPDTPKILFASTEYDFGKVDTNSQNTCTFEFINAGLYFNF